MRKLRIVSRNSQLALWQAHHVKDLLVSNNPNLEVEIIGITTKGDQILDRSLDKVGGKGLFIKELEHYLLNNLADIAVHSAKDLPANLPEELFISGFMTREKANDVLISNKYESLASMPVGSVIGTSSSRRVAILKKYYPQLVIKLLRGNLNTRLAKLDNNEYDGIILAYAGVKRLGWESRIKEDLALDKFIPAIGQGALAIEHRKDRMDLFNILNKLYCVNTNYAINVERQIGKMLNADCSTPLGCFVQINSNHEINVQAFTHLENSEFKSFSKNCSQAELDSLFAYAKECLV